MTESQFYSSITHSELDYTQGREISVDTPDRMQEQGPNSYSAPLCGRLAATSTLVLGLKAPKAKPTDERQRGHPSHQEKQDAKRLDLRTFLVGLLYFVMANGLHPHLAQSIGI